MKFAALALLASVASASMLTPRDLMARALQPRETTAAGGDAPDGTAQRNELLDKVERECKDVCKPVTTLFTDEKTKPCINLTEDELLKNADCRKTYCEALKQVFGCGRCQWKVIPHEGEVKYDEFDKQEREQQDRFCKDTGVDVTKH